MMKSFKANAAVLGSAILLLALSPGTVTAQVTKAAEQAAGAANPPMRAGEREVIPGAERMTSGEREAYRRRMVAATTPEEKARIRAEYAKPADGPAAARPLVGDPVRGATLHRACFACHGVERYAPPISHATTSLVDSVLRASGLSDLSPPEPARSKGRIKSLAALREKVNERNDYLNPKMTPQEVEHVVAYLNQSYYKFPQ